MFDLTPIQRARDAQARREIERRFRIEQHERVEHAIDRWMAHERAVAGVPPVADPEARTGTALAARLGTLPESERRP